MDRVLETLKKLVEIMKTFNKLVIEIIYLAGLIYILISLVR